MTMTDFTYGSLFVCFASMKSRGRRPASYFCLPFSRFPLTSILLSTFEMLLGCWAKMAWEDISGSYYICKYYCHHNIIFLRVPLLRHECRPPRVCARLGFGALRKQVCSSWYTKPLSMSQTLPVLPAFSCKPIT